jgi:hypothetical protein
MLEILVMVMVMVSVSTNAVNSSVAENQDPNSNQHHSSVPVLIISILFYFEGPGSSEGKAGDVSSETFPLPAMTPFEIPVLF